MSEPSTLRYQLLHRHIGASMEAVADLNAQLIDLRPLEVDEVTWVQVCVGIVEAMVNVARHGTRGSDGVWIELTLELDAKDLQIRIADNGLEIPAEAWAAADGSVFDFDPFSIGELPEGGMGLSLIRSVFDEVRYESAGGVNRLHLTFDGLVEKQAVKA